MVVWQIQLIFAATQLLETAVWWLNHRKTSQRQSRQCSEGLVQKLEQLRSRWNIVTSLPKVFKSGHGLFEENAFDPAGVNQLLENTKKVIDGVLVEWTTDAGALVDILQKHIPSKWAISKDNILQESHKELRVACLSQDQQLNDSSTRSRSIGRRRSNVVAIQTVVLAVGHIPKVEQWGSDAGCSGKTVFKVQFTGPIVRSDVDAEHEEHP